MATASRHSADGPAYAEVHGVIALELDRQARISRLTTIWDGSLVDNAAITTLLAATIEQCVQRPAVAAGRSRGDAHDQPGRAELGNGLRHGLPDPAVQRRLDLDDDLFDDDRHWRGADPSGERQRPLRAHVRHAAGHPMGLFTVGVPGLGHLNPVQLTRQ